MYVPGEGHGHLLEVAGHLLEARLAVLGVHGRGLRGAVRLGRHLGRYLGGGHLQGEQRSVAVRPTTSIVSRA